MLELVEVEKNFGSVQAVRCVDLKVEDGEFFSLLGPSGCGKSTLLRCLGGFETLTRGEIHQDGKRIDTLPPHERQFNMVFQRYALFPHLSVFENVAFGLRMKKVAGLELRTRVREILALVKLTGFEDRSTQTLSGGQQQRVALARALVNRPRVLLLDEPLSALDLKLRQQMQVELKAIQRRLGHTFIFVTHDQEEALTLSDRIAVMNEGRIEQVGTPGEIYENPTTEFAARFIGTINAWRGSVSAHEEERVTITLDSGLPLPELQLILPKAGGPVLARGERVQVLLRPEKIRITPGTLGGNQLAGAIQETFYQGATTHFVVDVGMPIWVSRPNISARAQGDLKIGTRVALSWSEADCLLLPGKIGP